MTRGYLALVAVLAGCSFTPATVEDSPDATVAPTADPPAVVHCTGKQAAKRDDLWFLTSGGLLRSVTVHVPESYDQTVGMPVVIDVHGFTSDAIQEQLLSGTPSKGDAEGFITLQPFGIGVPRSFNAGACCGLAAATHVDDVAFISALIDEVSDRLCVDLSRVYVTGMSNGGFLSNRLGCELADRIAAIAPVSGTLGISSCNPARPMPVMAFNGTEDPLVPYEGSEELGFLPVAETFAGWASRDGCVGTPTVTYQHGDATCLTYSDCHGGADVTQCTIDGGGHTWPGGLPVPIFGKTSSDISATDAMWTFFSRHSLADH